MQVTTEHATPRAACDAPKIAGCLAAAALAVTLWLSGAPGVAAIVLGLSLLAGLTSISLPAAVLAFLAVLPFDIQRQVAGQWLYLDLLGILLLIPLLRHGLPQPEKIWLLLPFFLYFTLATFPRILNPAWFYAFTARWLCGLVLCGAVAAAQVGERAVLVLGWTMIPVSVYSIYQSVIGDVGALFAWINPHMTEMATWTERASGFFWQPNNCGGFCGIVLVWLMAIAFGRVKGSKLVWLLAASAVIGLILSGSRGAGLATLAGLGLILISQRKLKLVLSLAAMLALVLMLTHHLVPDRMSEIDDATVYGRLAVNGVALDCFLSHPVWGIGTTNFSGVLPTMIWWPWDTIPTHNIFLQQLAETGLVGLVLFWAPVAALFRFAWQHRAEPLMLGCAAALVVFAIHGLFDYMFETAPQYLLLIFSLLGVILGRWLQADAASRTSPAAL